MSIGNRGYWLAKRGNTEEEYEDAFAGDASRGRFAVADGATESSFAGRWARLLVEGFVQEAARSGFSWNDWLPPLRGCWLAGIGDRTDLPWHVEHKMHEGAFAAFLACALDLAEKTWWAVAVGDCCLFQVRGHSLLVSFPIERAEEFSQSPWLVGSSPASMVLEGERETRFVGDWEPGDCFFLATDAIAQWFLTRHQLGEQPWEEIADVLAGATPFRAWIESLRNSRAIRNDDVTLLVIEV